MPWQAAPPLLIIIGAFNVAAGLIWTVDRVQYGKRGRTIMHDQWTWAMERRDDKVEAYRATKKDGE
eukprot:CAMPEP_0201865688 /NCGR_PEP_ID=MMETSP0902-20130614/505_1 /ASSEMBLY_ACC=CAM_ASM_000551 /TAXON_ID=420261 /ORGANISM="Thalassiosira antarctica, Strain CCMP982" /LENGTH=65 /DNA_ID=CAMNT_0048390507 /DNA_START=53 /DNA_END=250 /DNA_ORIENTATION=+